MAKWLEDNTLLKEGLFSRTDELEVLDIKDFNGTMDVDEAYRTVSNYNELKCYGIEETTSRRGDDGDYFSGPKVQRKYEPFSCKNFALAVDDDHVDELLRDMNNNFTKLGYDEDHMATANKMDFTVCYMVYIGNDRYRGDKPKFKATPVKASKLAHSIKYLYDEMVFGFFPTWKDAKAYVDAVKCYRNKNLKISSVTKHYEEGGANFRSEDFYDSNRPNDDHFHAKYNNRWWQKILSSGREFVMFFVED